MSEAKQNLEKDWINIVFLTLTPIIGVVGTIWDTWRNGFEPWMAILLVSMYLLVGFSICAGYHRLFSHRAYDAHPIVQGFFAFFGAMAAQNSILWWSSSHRVHHSYVDRDWDPYNIRRGFWWAHILWIFHRNPQSGNFDNATDLVKNPVVQWQNRWHKVILIVGGFGIPMAIGAMFGRPLAGLLWGGFLRLAVIHHTTFFVNSLAHTLGEPIYNHEVSARDNWMVALLTLGEGYHSFHHRFPADFRNGTRWYQWDPSKWLIAGLRMMGLARNLRTTSAPLIEKARLQGKLARMQSRLDALPHSYREEIRKRLARATENLEGAIDLWRRHLDERAAGMGEAWRHTRAAARQRLRAARQEWKIALRMLARAPQTV